MTGYYRTDPADPDAPRALQRYAHRRGLLRVGMRVRYENPFLRNADGTYRTAGMDDDLTLSALYENVTAHVIAILNDGKWEVNADNLVPDL